MTDQQMTDILTEIAEYWNGSDSHSATLDAAAHMTILARRGLGALAMQTSDTVPVRIAVAADAMGDFCSKKSSGPKDDAGALRQAAAYLSGPAIAEAIVTANIPKRAISFISGAVDPIDTGRI